MDANLPNAARKPVDSEDLARRYSQVRAATAGLIAPLDPEDTTVQSMPSTSPVKWHLAHTNWFFETFILIDAVPGYEPFDKSFGDLFNSFFDGIGSPFSSSQLGLLTRPNLGEVLAYREYVDRAILELLKTECSAEIYDLVELGLNHEQQHQELIVTDVKHLFSINPLAPIYCESSQSPHHPNQQDSAWLPHKGGLIDVGYQGSGFFFDHEGPPHQQLLYPFAIAKSLVTNREYLEFMEDGGYNNPEYWLWDGWDKRKRDNWQSPLYWRQQENKWFNFTLHGLKELVEDEPVCHISYYEADAYARWRGCRLPTEFEWETIAMQTISYATVPNRVSFHPCGNQGNDFFGKVWQWTSSPYTPYPGYKPPPGAIGEYNSKFMCNQTVLRGSSCATPDHLSRATYRNFIFPGMRWQFSGIRLAKDENRDGL